MIKFDVGKLQGYSTLIMGKTDFGKVEKMCCFWILIKIELLDQFRIVFNRREILSSLMYYSTFIYEDRFQVISKKQEKVLKCQGFSATIMSQSMQAETHLYNWAIA